jgi:hypothetical protein
VSLGRAVLRRANLELTEREDVLWVGRPTERPAVRYALRTAVVSLSVAAVAIGGYTLDAAGLLAGEFGSALQRAFSPTVAEGVGAVLVLVGLTAAGAVWWGKWTAANTWYFVTTRRLVFVHGRTAASVWLGQYDLMTVQLVDHGDGTGDLMFRRTRAAYDPAGGRISSAPPDAIAEAGLALSGQGDEQEMDVAFLGIRNAAAVRDLILRSYGFRRP